MYGVVLLSDQDEQKAVIWCEDHGDLAFYGGCASSVFDGPVLDAGDLVHFQVLEGNTMRLARNPELISEQHAPAIAERLKAAIEPASKKPSPSMLPSSEALKVTVSNVVPFPILRTA